MTYIIWSELDGIKYFWGGRRGWCATIDKAYAYKTGKNAVKAMMKHNDRSWIDYIYTPTPKNTLVNSIWANAEVEWYTYVNARIGEAA